jgi:hypothetical protein
LDPCGGDIRTADYKNLGHKDDEKDKKEVYLVVTLQGLGAKKN